MLQTKATATAWTAPGIATKAAAAFPRRFQWGQRSNAPPNAEEPATVCPSATNTSPDHRASTASSAPKTWGCWAPRISRQTRIGTFTSSGTTWGSAGGTRSGSGAPGASPGSVTRTRASTWSKAVSCTDQPLSSQKEMLKTQLNAKDFAGSWLLAPHSATGETVALVGKGMYPPGGLRSDPPGCLA